jgi:alpha-1,2-mannosyltransferase
MPAAVQHLRTKRSLVVTLTCVGAIFAIAIYLHVYGLSALAVDHASVRGWLSGDDLYAYRTADHLGSDIPPATAILLTPLSILPLTVAGWLIALAGVAALLLATIALAGPVARRYGKPRWAAVLLAGGLALLAEPVRAALGLGHLDLVVFGLLTADVVALRRSAWARRRATWWPGPASPRGLLRRIWATGGWAGVGVGIATAVAVGPVLFVAYLAVTRQWRAATTALATAGTLVLGGLLVAPAATAAWFGTVLPQIDRSVDDPVNQSLAGVLARLYDAAGIPLLVWLPFAGLLLAVGMIRARAAHADGDEVTAFTLIGLTSAAVCPVSRTHELIWLLPAMLIMVDTAARRRLAARRPRLRALAGVEYLAAAALVYLLCMVDPDWTLSWNAYAFVVIILLNTLPWRPGAAPALRVKGRPAPGRRQPAIPGPRGRSATGS